MTSQTSSIDINESIRISTKEILNDYQIACESRQISLMGRKEIFSGRAKFGIFGDGKEIAQLAMAKVFRNGDFRSGYYRDQTFMMAIGVLTLRQFFAQLYAHTDIKYEPATAGRCMNAHFATRNINPDGSWKNLMKQKNSNADISPTAGGMASLVGLAYASKLYKNNPKLNHLSAFSNNGNEIAFGTIGNASAAEGVFFEAVNAIGVLNLPAIISIWDDDYGISVPNQYQMTKNSVSEALSGFQRKTHQENGYKIFTAKGWDYKNLIGTYIEAEKICRKSHTPILIHIIEMTQPQGHSTSGSHERYKSKERLTWEKEYDCITQMRKWIIEKKIASSERLNQIENQTKEFAREAKKNAWKTFREDILSEHKEVIEILDDISTKHPEIKKIISLKEEFKITSREDSSTFADGFRSMKKALVAVRNESEEIRNPLINWIKKASADKKERYNTWLYNESSNSALKVLEIKPIFDFSKAEVDGSEVVRTCFDAILARDDRVFAIGEDIGKLGGVNQAFEGLQKKYGKLRVSDTGIREATIVGQGIGTALRGLRPIVDIQYLDYIYYTLQTLADDLSCLQYRTKGGQKAPVILRTKGHRLEGIWHSGSPISTLLGAIRGMYLLVPRNMTQASGFYNTMLKSDDTAIIIECLNGYRLKERIPINIDEFTVPLGIPDILQKGEDITIVTYGSMCRIVMEAATQLNEVGITCEVIDAQTLLPFDIHCKILNSIQKTNRVIFADEDVSGGATAYMMQKVIDEQNAYQWLDSKPVCITAKDHRPAYGSDGDYFSKPNTQDVFEIIYQIMHESDPRKYPSLY